MNNQIKSMIGSKLKDPLLKSIEALLVETQDKLDKHDKRYEEVSNPTSQNRIQREDPRVYGNMIRLHREGKQRIWSEFYKSLTSRLAEVEKQY